MIDYARTETYYLVKNSADYLISDTICKTIILPIPEAQLSNITIINESSIKLDIKNNDLSMVTSLFPSETLILLPDNSKYKYHLVAKIIPSTGPVGDYLPRDGTLPMTGELKMGNNKLRDLGDPLIGTDGVNINYLNSVISSTSLTPNTGDESTYIAGGLTSGFKKFVNGQLPRRVLAINESIHDLPCNCMGSFDSNQLIPSEKGTLPSSSFTFLNWVFQNRLNKVILAYDIVNKKLYYKNINSGIPGDWGSFITNPISEPIDMKTYAITNLKDPSIAQDAVTKKYVDNTGYLYVFVSPGGATGIIPFANISYQDNIGALPVRNATAGYIGFSPTSSLIGKRCVFHFTTFLVAANQNINNGGNLLIREGTGTPLNNNLIWYCAALYTNVTFGTTIVYNVTANTNFAISGNGAVNKNYTILIKVLGSSAALTPI